MGKLEQLCYVAILIASLTYGTSGNRINVHDMFHTIVNGKDVSRSISMQLLSRSTDEPITLRQLLSEPIELTGMDKQNSFVPFSNSVDEQTKETTVR